MTDSFANMSPGLPDISDRVGQPGGAGWCSQRLAKAVRGEFASVTRPRPGQRKANNSGRAGTPHQDVSRHPSNSASGLVRGSPVSASTNCAGWFAGGPSAFQHPSGLTCTSKDCVTDWSAST